MDTRSRISFPHDSAGRLRWVARLLTLLLVGIVVVTVVGDSVASLFGQTAEGEDVALTTADKIGIAGGAILLAGTVVALWRASVGAGLSAIGGLIFAMEVENGFYVLAPFGVIYGLYAAAAWLEREQETPLTPAS